MRGVTRGEFEGGDLQSPLSAIDCMFSPIGPEETYVINWPWKSQPSQAEINDLVRKQLRKYGDDGTRPRHVIHFAYPAESSTPLSKADVKSSLADLAVTFTETEDSEGVVFEHEREVASADFDDLTTRLSERFAAMGWKYDGWECAVEEPD